MILSRVVAGTSALALSAASISADITYISQDRRIIAQAEQYGFSPPTIPDGPTVAAADFGEFNQYIEEIVQLVNEPPGATNEGHASQLSRLLPDRITFSGNVYGRDSYGFSGVGLGIGYTRIDVRFSVSTPTTYVFDADAVLTGPGYRYDTGETYLRRVDGGSGGDKFHFNMTNFAAPVAADSTGLLEPGEYRFWFTYAAAGAGTSTSVTNVNYSGSLVFGTPAACDADFNASGAASVQDIYDFLADWSSQVAGGPVIIASADFNHAGGVTVQDIYDFLDAWSGGCP